MVFYSGDLIDAAKFLIRNGCKDLAAISWLVTDDMIG